MSPSSVIPGRDPGNGLHANLSREDYDALVRANFSTVKLIDKSPAHYRHALLEPREDTDALKNGRAVHLAVFEPELFPHAVAVWKGGRRYGKEWDAFRLKHAGRDILTESEHEHCLNLQRAIRGDARCKRHLEGGKGEVSVLWTSKADAIGGLPGYSIDCKGRLDFIGAGAIVDLKTTRDASPDAFGRACHQYAYHVQAAMYVDGVEAATGKRLPYVIVAAEMSPPCVVQTYVLPDYLIENGRQRYRAWLSRLAECRATGRWDGYADGDLDLVLPRWAGVEVPDEDGIEGLDLVINGEE